MSEEPQSGHQFILPGPAPEPFEVHPEDYLLVWLLADQPQLESEQLGEELLLQADLESKHSNDISSLLTE
jgi:hypothetical protein